VTTIDAAAAWRVRQAITLAVFAGFLGAGLGGCGTSSSLFGSPDGASSTTAVDQTAQPTAGQPAKIAIAPVIGAPDNVAKEFQSRLASAAEKQSVTVAKTPADKAEFTIRGYIVSAREKSGTKVSYIWDVTDPAGKRVNRITGEEVVAGQQTKDPWAAVTPELVESIASKTAGTLATWLPTQSQAAVAANVAATGGLQVGATPAQAAGVPPPAPAATGQTATTTGSIRGNDGLVNTMVPSVTGAPGDGGVSLTSAIQRELSRNGVALTDKVSGQTYRVEGKVVVGEAKAGKQPIQIDWSVKDPKGRNLGTVSQKNDVAQGSLDGPWGKIADAAASAAAQGILKLLPQTAKTN
jgi:hypothetical protein